MRYRYKELRLRTIKDLKKAELYQSRGWKVICVGINSILMERGVKNEDQAK